MSFLGTGKEPLDWIAEPLRHSVHRAPGCVQCGAMLEMDGAGFYALSGRCDNCNSRNLDETESFDDTEI